MFLNRKFCMGNGKQEVTIFPENLKILNILSKMLEINIRCSEILEAKTSESSQTILRIQSSNSLFKIIFWHKYFIC